MTLVELRDAIRALSPLPVEARIDAFNLLSEALGALVADVAPDPACSPRLLPTTEVDPNDYNPNKVAPTELDLLEQSMRADGITMCVVVAPAPVPDTPNHHKVVDGFHRRLVAVDRLRRQWLPCSIIDRPLDGLMASTVRHNRARGKHQVDLQGALVVAMSKLGVSDREIAKRLGMSVEEMLRLKQIVGAAKLIAGVEYNTTYGRTDEPPDLLDE